MWSYLDFSLCYNWSNKIYKDLDLVIIAEQANPPVAKILDYSKFLYEEKKKKAAAKKKEAAAKKKVAAAIAAEAKKAVKAQLAAAAAEVKAAKATLAAAAKREQMIMNMAVAKDQAVAKFVEKWTKQQMAKIAKSMKPSKKRKKPAAKK